jgi:uncharacterized membrane protein
VKAKLIYLWGVVSSSFWFIPLLLSLVLALTAVGLVALDAKSDLEFTGIWRFILPESDEAARTVLSTVATSILGVAGTVFSITLVVLTLAANQFGSRLVQNFMDDNLNQFVLGLYAGTFLYCIIALQTVRSEGEMDFVPKITTGFLLVLVIVGVVLLVYFIHHVSVSIQADHVIANTSKRLQKSLESIYPEKLGNGGIPGKWINNVESYLENHPVHTKLNCNSTGYLQAIAFKQLLDICTDNDLVVNLLLSPGDFAVERQLCIKVYSQGELSLKVKKKLLGTLAFGPVRTATQDAEFAIHQMVEIASRALSPGINDPYTAITCLDNLTASLCKLATIDFPTPFREDQNGKLRVLTQPESFEGFLDASYNQIRQFGKEVPSVIIRLMDNLHTLSGFTQENAKIAAIRKHAEMTLRAGKEFFSEKKDVEDLEERYNNFQNHL